MSGNSDDLLQRFRAGERDAVRTVGRLARAVVGHRAYYIPSAERDDLVQEAVLQIFRAVSVPTFRSTRAFEAFVRSVAQRRCVDWIRVRRPTEVIEPDPPDSTHDPEREVIAAEKRGRVRKALASLGYSCRRLIRLRVHDGLSYREIARKLERTEQGVRTQMYKCLRRVKDRLAPSGGRREGDRLGDGD